MNNKGLRPMTEGGILTAIAVIFALAGTYMPFIGIFASLFWPVPIAILGVRHGYKWSILATVVATVMIAALVHPLQAVTIAIGLGMVGIVFGYSFRAGDSPAKIVALGTIASLISNVAVLFIGAALTGINPLGDAEQLKTIMAEAIGFYQQLGVQGEQLDSLKKTIDLMLWMLQIALPVLLLISALFNAVINFWLIRKILNRFDRKTPGFPPFGLWQIPNFFVWALLGSIALLWFGQTYNLTITKDIAINVLIAAAIALFVQGISLLWFVFGKYNVNKLFRVIILLLVFVNGFFTQLVVLAGAFDAVFDYRKLKQRK
ncbi:MAG: YybS family protein [Negativicutes bacterium]|jgi:uncharacterized protein YybS (DUF2232 family)